VLLIGFGLVAQGLLSPGDDMLGWDTLSVMTLYLLLQFAPSLLVATRPGFTYFNRHRLPDERRIRRAELIPLGLPDVVSGGIFLTVTTTYVAFCLLILWVRQFDYPWFGGYANIVGVTFMNLFLWGCLAYGLYGRRRDPYASTADRHRSLTLTARILAFTSVAATLSIALSIVFAMLELREFIPAAKSVYFMLLAWVSFQEFRTDGVDFEVYRDGTVQV